MTNAFADEAATVSGPFHANLKSVSVPNTFQTHANSGGGIIRVLLNKTQIKVTIAQNNNYPGVDGDYINFYLEQNGHSRQIARFDMGATIFPWERGNIYQTSTTQDTLYTTTYTDSRQVIGEVQKSGTTGIMPGTATLKVVTLEKAAPHTQTTVKTEQVQIAGSVPSVNDTKVTSTTPSIGSQGVSATFTAESDVTWPHDQTFTVKVTDPSGNTVHSGTITKTVPGSNTLGQYNKTSFSVGPYSFNKSQYAGQTLKVCIDAT